MDDQLSFDFFEWNKSWTMESGLDRWRAERKSALAILAGKRGLPLGNRVRVDFENGPPLEGFLFLDQENLNDPTNRAPRLRLRIGTATFHSDEISCCVRID